MRYEKGARGEGIRTDRENDKQNQILEEFCNNKFRIGISRLRANVHVPLPEDYDKLTFFIVN